MSTPCARLAFILIGFFCSCPTLAQDLTKSPHRIESFQIPSIMKDILALSSAKFQGRQAGTEEGNQAANYVAQRFHALGLQFPFASDERESLRHWKQQAPITANRFFGPSHAGFFPIGLSTTHKPMPAILGKDFLPMFDSPSVNLIAPVVFVGYGIVDPARGVDDYQGMDVQNRVVMTLRGKSPTWRCWFRDTHRTHFESL